MNLEYYVCSVDSEIQDDGIYALPPSPKTGPYTVNEQTNYNDVLFQEFFREYYTIRQIHYQKRKNTNSYYLR